MKVKAYLRYLRIAPRKVRLVADLIRGKRVKEAKNTLTFCRKKAALPLLKLLNSAIANAKHNFKLDEDNLFISEILVNEGPRLKRIFPRSRGRADIIQKKTSHVSIFLEEIKEKEKEKPKK
jgi:large subunit ribosomal protein L22